MENSAGERKRADREIVRNAPDPSPFWSVENLRFWAARLIANGPNSSAALVTAALSTSWNYASRIVSREHALSLIDQAVVSATGFLTSLAIAHWSDSTELGVYALGLSVLLSVVGFQDSLILQPYIIQRHHSSGSPAERSGAALTLSFLFSAGNILLLMIAAFALTSSTNPGTAGIAWAVIGVMPFALTRDFVRRFDFAHLAAGRVLLLDLTTAIIQLTALGLLGADGHMSAARAYAALGAASAFPTAIWLYLRRYEFAIDRRHFQTTLRETWALGKWLLAGRVTVHAQQYVAYWLAAAIGGAAVTGVYAACMSIVGFANPLIMGLTNIYVPKSVLAWKHGGGPTLLHETLRSVALVAAFMMAFILAVAAGGEQAMRLFYHGDDFAGHGHTLIVLALATSVGAIGTPASIALATMERPRPIIIVTAIEAFTTLVLVWALITKLGLLGAAYGMLGGNVSGALGRWIAFYFLIPEAFHSFSRKSDDEASSRVLRQRETA